MNWPAIRAVVHKDLRIAMRNRGVRIPLIITPFLLLVFVPTFLVLGGSLLAGSDVAQASGRSGLPFDGFLPSVVEAAGETRLTWEKVVLEYLMAPLYLLVPMVVSAVIAADSFAGERERRTLEALLHTATDDQELFIGKLLAAYVPAVATSWIAFVVYSVVANLLGVTAGSDAFFPSLTWLLLAFWVAPGVSLLGIGLMVGVSSRVRSLQAAHQIGSLLVLPLLLLLIAQVTGLMVIALGTIVVFGGMLWVAGLLVVLFHLRTFNRDRVTSRL